MKILLIVLFIASFCNVNKGETVFTFTFHDTFKDGVTMAQYLNECRWRGTFYISSLRLCLHPDYMNREDVNALYLQGHQVGGHGLSHAKSFNLNERQLELQFCCNRELLTQYKWKPTTMAYPHGQYNNTIRKMAQHCAYCNALHVGGLKGMDTCTNCPTAETIPPVDKWKMKSYSVRGIDSLEDLINRVDMAIKDTTLSKKWVIFNFHKLCEDTDITCQSYTFHTLRSVFSRFVQYLKGQEAAQTVAIKNVKSVMHLDSQVLPVPRDSVIPFDSDVIELTIATRSNALGFARCCAVTLLLVAMAAIFF